MLPPRRILPEEPRPKSFDVICAGGALWTLAASDGRFSTTSKGVRLTAGGGPVNVALALAKEGLRIGLATVLADDAFGRASRESIAAAAVDVGGVKLACSGLGLVLVDGSGGARQVPASVEEEPPFQVPAAWSSQILLLSGLSPVVSHAAALCKAARRARRAGTLVVIDFNANMHVWIGRDPRTIHMVLREVDVARCSVADLAVLGMDIADVRAALRPGAVLVVSDGVRRAHATGPFGEIAFVPPSATSLRAHGEGDAFTVALCAELSRPGGPAESPEARWARVLRRGCAAAMGAG